jgi:hypothetical protein
MLAAQCGGLPTLANQPGPQGSAFDPLAKVAPGRSQNLPVPLPIGHQTDKKLGLSFDKIIGAKMAKHLDVFLPGCNYISFREMVILHHKLSRLYCIDCGFVEDQRCEIQLDQCLHLFWLVSVSDCILPCTDGNRDYRSSYCNGALPCS